eukprot:COSAG02_NODE_54430_length_296_cov_0.771574_1_plen_66_part_01
MTTPPPRSAAPFAGHRADVPVEIGPSEPFPAADGAHNISNDHRISAGAADNVASEVQVPVKAIDRT